MCKLGSELPSNVVSSFTKPKCQTPFTGLITCKVGVWWNDLLLVSNLVIIGDACFTFSNTRASLLFFLQQYHPLSSLLQVQHKQQVFLPPSWFLKYLSSALVQSAWTPFCRCLSVKSGYQRSFVSTLNIKVIFPFSRLKVGRWNKTHLENFQNVFAFMSRYFSTLYISFVMVQRCIYTFKVPFHIINKLNLEYVSSQRTGFGGGQPYKRHDYVEFPVLLNMDRWAPLKLCYLRIKYDRNLGTPTQVSLWKQEQYRHLEVDLVGTVWVPPPHWLPSRAFNRWNWRPS